MSILGKALAVLNVLVAALFVYLAILDYGARHDWSYLGFRFGIALNGPPVDATVTDPQGINELTDLDARTQDKLKRVGGQPLKTQEEELKRVQGLLQQQLDSPEPLVVKDPALKKNLDAAQPTTVRADGAAVQLQTLIKNVENNPNQEAGPIQDQVKALKARVVRLHKLAYLLEPFATTYPRREGLTRLMVAGLPLPEVPFAFGPDVGKKLQEIKQKYAARQSTAQALLQQEDEIGAVVLDQLQADFDGAFSGALGKRDPGEKHEAIAHVLVGTTRALRSDEELAEKPGLFQSTAFQRVLTTVGLEAAVKELDIQTSVLERMVFEAELAVERDRLGFAREHDQRLEQVAMLRQSLSTAADRRKVKDREVESQKELVASQEANVERVKRTLAQAQADTQKLLQQQTARERDVFARQGALREAVAKNRELEQRLRALEEKVR